MKDLTKAEEQLMRSLWKLKKGFLKDIMEEFPEPRPAYTTVSTVIRVLVKKGFIGFTSFGKIHEYYPLVSQDEYFRNHMGRLVKNYFSNSPKRFVSYFASEGDLNLTDLEELRQMIDDQIDKKKNIKE